MNHIAITSFPRSGSSYLRKYVEQVSGITTGSSLPMHTATSLQLLGMKGEGVTDDRVWVIKSHHPLKIPQSAEFKSSKTVVCIRNPLDVLISYANCLNTFSHDNKLAFDVNDKFPEWWSSFVKAETNRMK